MQESVFALIVRPGESPAEDALDDQMVSGSGRADPNSEVEFPLRPQIEINGREQLLLLILQRIEAVQRSGGCVVFQPCGNSFCEIVADLCIGREHYALINAWPMK